MTPKEIKRNLRKYSLTCKNVVPSKKEEKITELLKAQKFRKTRGSLFDFFCAQFGYLGKYCLIWQALWMILFYYLMKNITGNKNGLMVLLSVVPAILTLITVEDITRVYQRSMLEIEYATKYSLLNLVMIRMMTLCIFHSIVLVIGIVSVKAQFELELVKLLVYGFTPMMLMTGILISLMKYFKGEQLRFVGIVVYAGIIIFCVIGSMERFGIYSLNYFKLWETACASSAVILVYQFYKLRERLGNFEKLTQYD